MLLLYTFFFFLEPTDSLFRVPCPQHRNQRSQPSRIMDCLFLFFFFSSAVSVFVGSYCLLLYQPLSFNWVFCACLSIFFFFFFACPFLSWPMICSVSSALKTRVHVGSFGSSTPTQWKEGRCCGTITITKKKKKSHFFLLLLYDANSSKWISSASENVNVVGLCHSESCDTWQRRFEREA